MIPHGKVASYGQIALYAGLPRAAREVGWVLRGTKETMPWWRVVNKKGKISIDGNMHADKALQKKLLEAEGITVNDDFTVAIEQYRWVMSDEQIRTLQLPDAYIQNLIEKHGL